MGLRFEEVYRNTHLKQERGAQIEAIRSEVFAMYASKQGSDSSLVATAMGAAAASLGGLGGLGPSTSNPEVDPSAIKAEEEEEEEKDETVPEAPKPAADLSLKKSTGEPASSSSADSPSRPPHDEEDSQTSTSSSKSIADPIVQTGVGAAARGLGGVGGLGQSNSEQEEEAASSSEPSQISSADLAKDPIVQTAIGAAALGLGGVGGLGRSSSEPSPSPGTKRRGAAARSCPWASLGLPQLKSAEPSRYRMCLYMDIVMKWQMHFDQFILLLCIKRARENVTALNRQMSPTFVCIHMSAHEYCVLATLKMALDCPSYESKLSVRGKF